MRSWAGLDDVDDEWGPCVVTIGMFDGVHRGHVELIETAVSQAAGRGVRSVLMTFEPHPRTVVTAGAAPARLTTSAHRADLVAGLGVDAVLVVPFTPKFAALGAEQFVRELLVDRLRAVGVVVGDNFTYGARAAGTAESLAVQGAQLGVTITTVGLLVDGGATVSASRIRALVDAGDVEQVARLLGHPFRSDGVVVRGQQRGRALGYPTANIDMAPDCAVAADGVYAGRVVVLDAAGHATGEVLGNAAISVGTNPTFDAQHRTVEAFILDFDADLYGDRLGVEFWHRLRGMVRFDSVDALIAQMDADTRRTRELMSAPRPAR